MFSDKRKIEKFNAEIILRITTFLDLTSILQLTLTSKSFSHLMKDELVFKRLVERDFGITDKTTEESWLKMYERLKTGKKEEKEDQQVMMNGQSHEIDYPEATATLIIEIKRVLYKSHSQNPSLCDICQTQNATYLNMHPSCHSEGKTFFFFKKKGYQTYFYVTACRICLDNYVEDEKHYPIQLQLDTGDLYCFKCSKEEPHKVFFFLLFEFEFVC